MSMLHVYDVFIRIICDSLLITLAHQHIHDGEKKRVNIIFQKQKNAENGKNRGTMGKEFFVSALI